MVTHTSIKGILHYNPVTGLFVWAANKRGAGGRVRAGKVAGTIRPNGYVQICIDGRLYRAHRLAWLYVYGNWPAEIDHINGDRADNRISNLRICTRSQNRANSIASGASGVKGVSKRGRRWVARIGVSGGGEIYLGRFDDKEAASLAYLEAAKRLFGEFAKS